MTMCMMMLMTVSMFMVVVMFVIVVMFMFVMIFVVRMDAQLMIMFFRRIMNVDILRLAFRLRRIEATDAKRQLHKKHAAYGLCKVTTTSVNHE